MGFEIREINVENLDYISKLVEDEDAALLIIGINTNKEIQLVTKCLSTNSKTFISTISFNTKKASSYL